MADGMGTANLEGLRAELAALVGEEFVAAEGEALRVLPGSTEEVAAVLRVCSGAGTRVVPTGGGTKLDWGNPVDAQVWLGTARLGGIREHVWGDMTATVGAGTRWAAMQDALAEHGQMVALDPLFAGADAGAATVGGVLAMNDSGAMRVRYGSLRDLVLGATVVLADGTAARSGGKVVKNVAGYDLPKLLTGSFGTLGVVSEVTFRLHPVERTVAAWTVRGAAAEMGRLMPAVAQSGMSVQALQVRCGGADAGALTSETALDVRFASTAEALAEHAVRLRMMAGELAVEPAEEGVWEARQALFAREGEAVLKVTALPNRLGALLGGFAQVNGARCVAEPVGIVTVALAGEAAQVAAIVEDLRARLRGEGGMVAVLRWPFAAAMDRWGGSPPAVAVMREIKAQFDPGRVLNPGRFVGGI